MEILLNFSPWPTSWVGIVIDFLLYLMPFAILGFLFAKHRKEDPSYLIGFERMNGLKNAWTLLLVLTAPLVFIYNVFVWAAYAFVVFVDFVSSLLKTIYEYLITPILKAIMWLLNALLWGFLNLIWVPVKMVAKAIYHYCILWVWDLYSTSFLALNGTYNKSKLRIAFIGAFYALAIIGLSVYLSILTGFVVIGIIGAVISYLPIVKSLGTLTSIAHGTKDADHNEHGAKVMKTALNYVIATLIAIGAVHVLLYLSIIPDFGLIILGIAVNANVIFSGIAILSLIVLFLAKAIMPNHLLHNDESTSFKESVVNYLYATRDKGLQMLLSLIPGTMWSAVVLAIPVLFIYASISMADSFKTNILSVRGGNIQKDIIEANSEVNKLTANFTSDQIDDIEDAFETAIELNARSNQNTFGLGFPNNVFEHPEIILNKNTTDYTVELPKMHKGAIADTLSLRSNIKLAEKEIKKLNAKIAEYKSQKWEYIIQRKNAKEDGNSWITISSGADISRFVDKDVQVGESFSYRVKVKNAKGVSNWSIEVNDMILSANLKDPSDLIVKTNLNFEAIMQWTDNSYNEDNFVIERKLSEESVWTELANIDSDVRQYTDNTVVSGRTYDYRVYAVGIGQKSTPTNIVTKSFLLSSPYDVNSQANLKSVLVDWSYSAWNYKRASLNANDRHIDNAKKGVYANSKKSFVDLLNEKIAEQEDIIVVNKEKLEYANQRIEMFASLIEYDTFQRGMLKMFKNIAFLFALLFIALFGGVVLSFVITYASSLFYNIYRIRANDPWYFLFLIKEEKKKNSLQPLLGLTWPLLFLVYFTFFGSGLGTILEIFTF